MKPAITMILLAGLMAGCRSGSPKHTMEGTRLLPPTDPLGLVEGELWGLGCATQSKPHPNCTDQAIREGLPVGLLVAEQLISLLMDSRVLQLGCETREVPRRLRVRGINHVPTPAVTVFAVEEYCKGNWRPLDFPASGISTGGWEAGDE